MTIPEAHARLSQITGGLRADLSSAEVRKLQTDLFALIEELPTTPEFNATADTIRAAVQKIDGQLSNAVLAELQSRTAALGAATATLSAVAAEAAADARTLSFAQPRLIAAGLKNGIALVQQLQQAAHDRNFNGVAQNAESLLALLATLRNDLKTG